MIVENAYNHKSTEYFKFDDIQEDNISRNIVDRKIIKCDDCKVKNDSKCPACTYTVKRNRLNSTSLERHLARVNVGSKRRIRNNHAARLAAYKAR